MAGKTAWSTTSMSSMLQVRLGVGLSGMGQGGWGKNEVEIGSGGR